MTDNEKELLGIIRENEDPARALTVAASIILDHSKQQSVQMPISRMSNTRLYRIWTDMKDRCNRPKNIHFDRYGGRGIRVCSEWENNYQSFYNWAISSGYEDNLTIDRIDVNGNYEPSNCRWLTISEQQHNKEYVRLITIRGETKPLAEWARCTGLKYGTIWRRIKRGKAGPDLIKAVSR